MSNFQPLHSTNFATVGAKFVFLDFLESKELQSEKTISHFISTQGLYVDENRKKKNRFFDFCLRQFGNR